MKRILFTLVTTMLLVVPLVLPASAVSIETSWSGNDYTRNSSSGKTLYVRDGEDDGNSVRGEYVLTGGTTQYSLTNSGGPFTTISTTRASNIYRHRVVEVIAWSVDDYGPWVYPY